MKTKIIALAFVGALSLNFADAQAASDRESRKHAAVEKELIHPSVFNQRELTKLANDLIETYIRNNCPEDTTAQVMKVYDVDGELEYEGPENHFYVENELDFLFELNSVDYYINKSTEDRQ